MEQILQRGQDAGAVFPAGRASFFGDREIREARRMSLGLKDILGLWDQTLQATGSRRGSKSH